MKNMIDDKLSQNIVQKPEFIQFATNQFGQYSFNIAKILSTLNMLSSEKCMQFSIEEFKKMCGKNGKQNLRQKAKNADLKGKLRIVEDKGTVYIWVNSK